MKTIASQLNDIDGYIWQQAHKRSFQGDLASADDLHSAAVVRCIGYLKRQPHDPARGTLVTYLKQEIHGAMVAEQRRAAPIHIPKNVDLKKKDDLDQCLADAMKPVNNAISTFNASSWTTKGEDLIDLLEDKESLSPEEEAIAEEQYRIHQEVLDSDPDFRAVWEATFVDGDQRGHKAVAKALGAGWTEYRVKKTLDRCIEAIRQKVHAG